MSLQLRFFEASEFWIEVQVDDDSQESHWLEIIMRLPGHAGLDLLVSDRGFLAQESGGKV